MKAVVTHYLNDIVSLTVLALMAVALVAGQSDASAYGAVEIVERTVFRAEIDVRLGLSDLAKLDVDKESIEALRDIIEASFERGQ